jgi:serine phosphatase RsbU (regulator of sigma subunit)
MTSTSIKAQSKADSVVKLLDKTGEDTNRVVLYQELRKLYGYNSPTKSFEYAKLALELAQKINYLRGTASAYAGLGSFYRQQGDYAKATEYQLLALKIYEKIGKYTGISAANNNLGVLYYRQGNWQEALKYYRRALLLAVANKEEEDEAVYLLNIGEVYQELNQYDSAIFYENKVIEISERLAIPDNIAYAVGIIGQVYMAQKKYEQALKNEKKALLIFEKLADSDAMAEYQADIAMVYLAMQSYDSAKLYADKCLATAQANESKQWQKEAYLLLSKLAEKKGEFEKAHQYFKHYTVLKDTIFNENSTEKMHQVQAIYETEKKQTEIDLLKKSQEVQQEQIKQQTLLLYLGAVIGVLIIFFALFLYRNNQQKQKINLLLQAQKQAIEQQNRDLEGKNNLILLKNVELEQQKEEIFAQAENLQQAHEKITIQRDVLEIKNLQIKKKSENIESSIRYAQRIQQAFLPSNENLMKAFSQFFIVYKPKDIVSGDFYWLYQEQNLTITAVADCTGHGVPGALMSMMANSLLNQTINDRQIIKPNLILDELHKGIRKALNQLDSDNRDGMDIALLAITKNDKVFIVEYAGANNSLVFFESNQMQEYKADKMAIGGFQQEKTRHFGLQTMVIENEKASNYQFYLFSDGYQDQFGGDKGRKLGKAGFKDLLAAVHTLPLPEQGRALEDNFVAWKNAEDQIDDILVLGFRL